MSKPGQFKFRLYVAGQGPHSEQAVLNLTAICREYLPDRHEIETIDVLQNQEVALSDGVMLTPLLVRLSPGPIIKIAGTLLNRDAVLQALGLFPEP